MKKVLGQEFTNKEFYTMVVGSFLTAVGTYSLFIFTCKLILWLNGNN